MYTYLCPCLSSQWDQAVWPQNIDIDLLSPVVTYIRIHKSNHMAISERCLLSLTYLWALGVSLVVSGQMRLSGLAYVQNNGHYQPYLTISTANTDHSMISPTDFSSSAVAVILTDYSFWTLFYSTRKSLYHCVSLSSLFRTDLCKNAFEKRLL